MATRAETVTILFTDLGSSTELLQRAGDEQAQRISKAHHRLLREAAEAHGGHEVKWLGPRRPLPYDHRCSRLLPGDLVETPAFGEPLEPEAPAVGQLDIRGPARTHRTVSESRIWPPC